MSAILKTLNGLMPSSIPAFIAITIEQSFPVGSDNPRSRSASSTLFVVDDAYSVENILFCLERWAGAGILPERYGMPRTGMMLDSEASSMPMNDFMTFYVKDVTFYRDESSLPPSNTRKIASLRPISGLIDALKNGGNEDYLNTIDAVRRGEVNTMPDTPVGKILSRLMRTHTEEVLSAFADGTFSRANIEVFTARTHKALVDFYEDVKTSLPDTLILMQPENSLSPMEQKTYWDDNTFSNDVIVLTLSPFILKTLNSRNNNLTAKVNCSVIGYPNIIVRDTYDIETFIRHIWG